MSEKKKKIMPRWPLYIMALLGVFYGASVLFVKPLIKEGIYKGFETVGIKHLVVGDISMGLTGFDILDIHVDPEIQKKYPEQTNIRIKSITTSYSIWSLINMKINDARLNDIYINFKIKKDGTVDFGNFQEDFERFWVWWEEPVIAPEYKEYDPNSQRGFASRLTEMLAKTLSFTEEDTTSIVQLLPQNMGLLRAQLHVQTPEGDVDVEGVSGLIKFGKNSGKSTFKIDKVAHSQFLTPASMKAEANFISDNEMEYNAEFKNELGVNFMSTKGRFDIFALTGSGSFQIGPVHFKKGGLQPKDISPIAANFVEEAKGELVGKGTLDIKGIDLNPQFEIKLTDFNVVSHDGVVKGLNAVTTFERPEAENFRLSQKITLQEIRTIDTFNDIDAHFILDGVHKPGTTPWEGLYKGLMKADLSMKQNGVLYAVKNADGRLTKVNEAFDLNFDVRKFEYSGIPKSAGMKVKGRLRQDDVDFDVRISDERKNNILHIIGVHNLKKIKGHANLRFGPFNFAPGVLELKDIYPPATAAVQRLEGRIHGTGEYKWDNTLITPKMHFYGKGFRAFIDGNTINNVNADLFVSPNGDWRKKIRFVASMGSIQTTEVIRDPDLQKLLRAKTITKTNSDRGRFELNLRSKERTEPDPVDGQLRVTGIEHITIDSGNLFLDAPTGNARIKNITGRATYSAEGKGEATLKIADISHSNILAPVDFTASGQMSNYIWAFDAALKDKKGRSYLKWSGDYNEKEDAGRAHLTIGPFHFGPGWQFGDISPQAAELVTNARGVIRGGGPFWWKKGKAGADANFEIKELGFDVADHRIEGMNMLVRLDRLDPISTLPHQKFTIREVKGPVSMRDILVDFEARKDLSLHLNRAFLQYGYGHVNVGHTELFPITHPQHFDIDIKDISLREVIKASQVPGLSISGSVTGKIPVILKPGFNLEIHKGFLKTNNKLNTVRYDLGVGDDKTDYRFMLITEALKEFNVTKFDINLDHTAEGSKLLFEMGGFNTAVLRGFPFHVKMTASSNLNKFIQEALKLLDWKKQLAAKYENVAKKRKQRT